MPDDDREESAAHAATVAGDTVAAPAAARVGGLAWSPGSHSATHFIRGRELARGGMGRVVVADDRHLERTVALKLLQRVSPGLRARFEREANITARLAHPAIVPIYDAGELEDGEPFYAMKLVEGMPLDEAIAKAQGLPARLALLASGMAVCEALAYAHSKHIIHRDLKPANVLVGKFGETVVIDWGLAKDLRATAVDPVAARSPSDATLPDDAGHPGDATVEGQVMGTPSYMPPEQATGVGVDERADVYALGALLYHVVAGRPPYLGRTAGEILAALEAGPPPALATVEPAVPDDLASIIGKAMARTPAARYPTAGALADELRRFIDGRLVATHRYSGAELLRRWVRRHRTAVAVGGVALGVLAVGAVISVRQIVARDRVVERELAESQLEQGRQLLVADHPGQAAPYLAAALAELPDDPVARRLAAIALRETPRRIANMPGTSVAFRADGRELAVGQHDGSIVIVDPGTGAALRTLAAPRDHGGDIAELAYAPDGAGLAVATSSGAYLCDAGSGAAVAIAGAGPATGVRFLPGGDRLVVTFASMITIVRRDGVAVASDGHVHAPLGLATSADGAYLAALSAGGVIEWRTADLSRVMELPASAVPRYALAFDHGQLITAGADGVQRWAAADRPTTLLPDQVVTLLPLDERTLLADEAFVDTGTGTDAVRRFASDPIQAAALVDRTHVLTGGYDHTLRLWDLERTAHPLVVLDADSATALLVVDPTGTHAVSRGKAPDARVELWSVARPRTASRVAVVGSRVDRIVANHGDRLAVHASDGTAQGTKLVSSTLELVASVEGWPLGFHPGADELVTDIDGRLGLYSARTGAHLRDITDAAKLWHVAFSPSGRAIATSSTQHVSLRDAAWTVVATFDTPGELPGITALAVDDRERVVTGHEDGTVRIWNARTGAVLTTIAAHAAHVTDVQLRGDELVTASWDLSTRRWAFPSGEGRGILERFDRLVDDAGISPDGQLLVAADGAAEVKLWDGAQGRLIEEIPTMESLTCVEFIDDEHVVAGGAHGRLEVFELTARTREPAEAARLLRAAPRWQLVNGRAVERP